MSAERDPLGRTIATVNEKPNARARVDPFFRRLVGMGKQVTDYDVDEPRSFVLRAIVRIIRFCIIYAREVRGDILWERAASLTYTTILSLFPLLVLVTSLGAIFYTPEQEDALVEYIERRLMPPIDIGALTPQEQLEMEERGQTTAELIGTLREMSSTFRERAPQLGFLGFIALLITAFALYRSIENAFKASWATARKRTLKRTISGFAMLLIGAPIILALSIAASSLLVTLLGREDLADTTLFLNGAVETEAVESAVAPEETQDAPEADLATDDRETTPALATDDSVTTPTVATADAPEEPGRAPFDLARIIVGLITPLFNSLMLALAYMMIPQAKVRFQYALIGGLAAGFLWEGAKVAFFYYVYTSALRQELFASLGAVPIFLIWIYFTWIVFLLGNELVYVTQHLPRLMRVHFGRTKIPSLLDGKVYVAMALLVADAFLNSERGLRRGEIARHFRMRIGEMEEAINLLLRQGIFHQTEEERIIMGVSPESLKVRDLLMMGCDTRMLCDRQEFTLRPGVRRAIGSLQKRLLDANEDVTLADLLADSREKDETKAT